MNKIPLSSKYKDSNPVPVLDTVKVRLSSNEYTALEKVVEKAIYAYKGKPDAGSLGVQVGAELVLRAIREGFSIG